MNSMFITGLLREYPWKTLTVLLSLIIHMVSSENLKFNCSKLQYWERRVARNQCTGNNTVYHCAFDLFNKSYQDICRKKPILIRIGNRPTIQGGLHYGKCPNDRYQPFHVISNKTVDCWYLKSLCSEEGQIVYNRTSPDSDVTCSCDYTKGYAFVQEPANPCFCNPTIEDCSCYKKECVNLIEVLNSEYDCVLYNVSFDYGNNSKCKPEQEKDVQRPTSSLTPQEFLSSQSATYSNIISFIALLSSMFFCVCLCLFVRFACPFCQVQFVEKEDTTKQHQTLKVKVIGPSIIEKVEILVTENNKQTLLREKPKITKYGFARYLEYQVDTSVEDRTYECVVYNKIGCPFRHHQTVKVSEKKKALVAKKENNRTLTLQKIKTFKANDAFYVTTAIDEACKKLENFKVVILLGGDKCGKSIACLHIATLYIDRGFSIYRFSEWDEIRLIIDELIYDNENECFIFDFNVDSSLKNEHLEDFIDRLKTYEGNEKKVFILTTKTTETNNRFLDLQVKIDNFKKEDKRGILEKHMLSHGIETCESYSEATYMNQCKISNKEENVKIYELVIDQIVDSEDFEYFPDYCRLFCSNQSLLQLEDRYFKNPTKTVIKTISLLRLDCIVEYVCLVYVLMQNHLDRKVNTGTIGMICNKLQMEKKKIENYKITSAAISLESKKYLTERNGKYEFINEMTRRAVWISYMDIDESYCVMNCPWSYIEDLIRPDPWEGDENDVCISITSGLNERLMSAIVDMGSPWSVGVYLSKLVYKNKNFVGEFCDKAMTNDNLKGKGEQIVRLLDGITDNGKNHIAISECSKLVEMIQWPGLEDRNCFLHYGILKNYTFLSLSKLEDIFVELFTEKNDKSYTAYEIAFFFGRYDIAKTHEKNIPADYSYIQKLGKLHIMGGKHAKKIVETKHLKWFALNLPSLPNTLKFGRRQDFIGLSGILRRMKSKATQMLRIKGLQEHVGNKRVQTSLEFLGCEVINLYHERYHLKGQLLEKETGDIIVVSEFGCNNFPTTILIREHKIQLESMIIIKLLNMPTSTPLLDLKIQNAMALLNIRVREIYPKETGNALHYMLICEYTEDFFSPELYSDAKEKEIHQFPPRDKDNILNIRQIPIDQTDIDINKFTMIRLKRVPNEVTIEEVKNVLTEKNVNVIDIYKERHRKQGLLSNIRTGDRIAICKPLKMDLPTKLPIMNINAEIVCEKII